MDCNSVPLRLTVEGSACNHSDAQVSERAKSERFRVHSVRTWCCSDGRHLYCVIHELLKSKECTNDNLQWLGSMTVGGHIEALVYHSLKKCSLEKCERFFIFLYISNPIARPSLINKEMITEYVNQDEQIRKM